MPLEFGQKWSFLGRKGTQDTLLEKKEATNTDKPLIINY